MNRIPSLIASVHAQKPQGFRRLPADGPRQMLRMEPAHCDRCDRPALYRVAGFAFCKQHRAEAVARASATPLQHERRPV